MLGDEQLFLCRSFWTKKGLRGGANPIELLSREDAFPIPEKMNEFSDWFSYSCDKEINIGLTSVNEKVTQLV